MSCPYAHSPSCFRKDSTQMDTLLDSLHRPHAYLPTMAPRSSNMEHSTPTSTGDQKVPRPPTASTHDGLLLTPGPAILGLLACHRLRIVELNCAVNLLQKKLMQQKTSMTECQKVQDDLEKLKPFSSREDLINAYPDRFKGIRRFPGTYHITLRKDAQPVVHAPRKCPIATWPLVHEKLDEWLKEGIITPVEEPTDWVSSLAYSHKANGKLRICLDPKDLNAAIKRDHYKTPAVEEITHELAGSRKFTKLDGTSSYLCIVLD